MKHIYRKKIVINKFHLFYLHEAQLLHETQTPRFATTLNYMYTKCNDACMVPDKQNWNTITGNFLEKLMISWYGQRMKTQN